MKVPVVTGPTVSADPLKTPELQINAGPGAFGASIAQGIGTAAGVGGDIYREAKDEYDKAQAIDLVGLVTDQNNQAVTEEQQNKLNGAKGGTDRLKAKVRKNLEMGVGLAENPRVKRLVYESGFKQGIGLVDAQRGFEANQIQLYNDASAKLTLEATGDLAYKNPDSETVVADAISQAIAVTNAQTAGKYTEPQRKQFAEAAASAVRSQQLQAMADDPNRETEFLHKYLEVKDQLRGIDARKFGEIAAKTSDLKLDQAYADHVFEVYGDNPEAGYKWIQDNLEGKREDAVRQRYATMRATAKSVADEQRVDNANKLGEYFNQHGFSLKGAPIDLRAAVDKYDPDIVERLNAYELADRSGNTPKRTNFDSWSSWMYSTDDFKASPEGDPNLHRNEWKPDDYQSAVRYRTEILAGRKKAPGGGKTPTTESDKNEYIKSSWSMAYGGKEPKTDPEKKRFLFYSDQMRRDIERYQNDPANKTHQLPTRAELEKLSAYWLIQGVVVDNGWMGRSEDTGRRYQAAAKGKEFIEPAGAPPNPFDMPFDQEPQVVVPADFQKEAIERYKKRGITATEEQIRNSYRIYLERVKAQQQPVK